ncbi:MAG: hypothetical protein RLZZ490_770, partial [Cyanobacteriota bacterium]
SDPALRLSCEFPIKLGSIVIDGLQTKKSAPGVAGYQPPTEKDYVTQRRFIKRR